MQAVQCCRGYLLPAGSHPEVAIATKKRGLVFCCMQRQQPAMSARSLRYSQLHERVRSPLPPPSLCMPAPQLHARALRVLIPECRRCVCLCLK